MLLKEFYADFKDALKNHYEPSEIRILLKICLEDLLDIYTLDFDKKLDTEQIKQLTIAQHQLIKHIPIQHITEKSHFYGLILKVNSDVLIPRPETEELTDLILKQIKPSDTEFLDLATGSGCIALAIKNSCSRLNVEGCDISEKALKIAKENAERLKLQIYFYKDDILKLKHTGKTFDVMVSNPPYILETEAAQMHKNVFDHEPHLALFEPKKQSIFFYKKIIEFAKTALKPGGRLYFELNPLTANQVYDFANTLGFHAQIKNDLSGKARFMILKHA